MYDALNTAELAVLQDMLYTAAEKAFRLANFTPDQAHWLDRYRSIHGEVAWLFLEAGHELVGRLDATDQTTTSA